MGSLLLGLVLASAVAGQCGCGVATLPINPGLNLPGWSAGGNIVDNGSTPGSCHVPPVCPAAAVPCTHKMLFAVWLECPANTNPLPTLTVRLVQGDNRTSFEVPPSNGFVLPNGNWRFEWNYPLEAQAPCGQAGTIDLQWACPGGAAPQNSGSVALSCGNC